MHLIWGLEKPPYRALHPDDKWNLEKNLDASLRLPDSRGAPTSCSPLKEQVICSSPALYIKCVIRLRAVGWGIEGALSGPVVSRPAVDITEKTDSELRDVAERARWAVQGCWKWVYQPPPPPPPPPLRLPWVRCWGRYLEVGSGCQQPEGALTMKQPSIFKRSSESRAVNWF